MPPEHYSLLSSTEDTAHPELATARSRLATALVDVRRMVAAFRTYFDASKADPRELYRIGLQSVPFLLSVGDLLIGWLLVRHAEVAINALTGNPAHRERAFYGGKVAAAKFFANNVLPKLSAACVIIEVTDHAVMHLPDDAF